MSPPSLLPVTLLSGFLGAGKTTLLEHILRNKQGIRCAVIVNDMAEVNIDASLVKGTRLLQTNERMVELHNGCICCTLREDLLVELRQLAVSGAFDVVIIESTGVAEPMQVAETFFMTPPDGGPPLGTVARLDNCITVVDASTFADNLRSVESITEKFGDSAAAGCQTTGPIPAPTADSDDDGAAVAEEPPSAVEDDRNVAHLLVDQVEFANVVIINKSDIVTPETLLETKALIAHLNPTAFVVVTQRSEVDLRSVLFTSKFSEAFAIRAKGWMSDIESNIKHTPETVEYGITSFVFRATVPFHPKRLYDVITRYFLLQEMDGGADNENAPGDTPVALVTPEVDRSTLQVTLRERQRCRTAEWGNVLRSKGYAWIGSLDRLGGFAEWNHAGNVLSFGYAGGWGMFPDPNADKLTNRAGDFAAHFIEKTPCQEIVLIGQDLRCDAINQALRNCLLTPDEEATLIAACQSFHAAAAAAGSSSGVAHRPRGPFEDPFERWPEDDDDEADEDNNEVPESYGQQQHQALQHANHHHDSEDDDDAEVTQQRRGRHRGGGMK